MTAAQSAQRYRLRYRQPGACSALSVDSQQRLVTSDISDLAFSLDRLRIDRPPIGRRSAGRVPDGLQGPSPPIGRGLDLLGRGEVFRPSPDFPSGRLDRSPPVVRGLVAALLKNPETSRSGLQEIRPRGPAPSPVLVGPGLRYPDCFGPVTMETCHIIRPSLSPWIGSGSAPPDRALIDQPRPRTRRSQAETIRDGSKAESMTRSA